MSEINYTTLDLRQINLALSELELYKTIGTVEEFARLKSNYNSHESEREQ